MRYRTLGKDLTVSALGLGCMGMTGVYGEATDHSAMIKLIHDAFPRRDVLRYGRSLRTIHQ